MAKKRSLARSVALTLAIITAFAGISLFPASAGEGNGDFSVVVSMEGLTLGQGFYIKPAIYTLSEINDLAAKEGFGELTEKNVTAAAVTAAILADNDLDCKITGTWDDNAYLSAVRGVDSGCTDIPNVITDNGGPSNENNSGNSDDYLGEFDYSPASGWMISVNDEFITSSISDCVLENNAVIRWQFTLWGYGADIGAKTEWGDEPYFDAADRTELYRAYASCNDDGAKAKVLEVMENLTSDQAKTDSAANLLGASAGSSGQSVTQILEPALAALASKVPAPKMGSTSGEWVVLALARGGYFSEGDPYFENYYSEIVKTVAQKSADIASPAGALDEHKSTENSRLIIALAAIGKDPTDVGGCNIVEPLSDISWMTYQGINGPIYALIALDASGCGSDTLKNKCIELILQNQLPDGGWDLRGFSADPDMTAMALQALAPYKDRADVKEAADSAFARLSELQKNDSGGFASWGSVNAESIAQVIVACTAWGINPDSDERFVKSGGSVVDALLSFYIENEAAFKHTASTGSNQMATEQACYALVAYDRFISGKPSLYDMTKKDDVSTDSIAASLTVPAMIENIEGSSFNATISLNSAPGGGYRLLDCIAVIPPELSVTGVFPGENLVGGQISYNLERDTGKLRIVYFDPNDGSEIGISEKSFPAEAIRIGLVLDSPTDKDSLSLSVTGMSLKKNSHSDKDDSMTVVDVSRAAGSVSLTDGVSISAAVLYTGDGVDLIPSDKSAVAVAVTGISGGRAMTYSDGSTEIPMNYSPEVSEKTGISTYVFIIPSDSDLSALNVKSNYAITDADADKTVFGDANGDGNINAQDALAAVNTWLRRSGEPDDCGILAMNVNADPRLNTFDALGIVEKFVDGAEPAVVGKAAALANGKG